MNTTTDSVRIVLFSQANPQLFLVLAETDDPTNWKLPGGKFNSEDETPEAAVSRELNEELGLTDLTVKQVGQLTNDDGVSARYIFAVQIDEKQVVPSAEVADIQWVSEETIPETPNKAHVLSAVGLARGQ